MPDGTAPQDFAAPIAKQIWDMKYRLKAGDGTPLDADLSATRARVARALASVESDPAAWEPRFAEALDGFAFLPAGRILAGAGTDRRVTLFNCFVMGTIPDSIDGIFAALRESALTMQAGGGIGMDFSTIRPKGQPVHGVAADASGPLSFMDVWDSMCRTIMSAGSRRGAMMATLRVDHPDIEAFIDAKRDPARLRMFNLSVLVTDAFMDALAADGDWPLVWQGRVVRTVRAATLWDRIMRATYDMAEPGVIFIDRINAANNLSYAETISATNPCGEQPLPPYGACLLGSVNLAALVLDPYGPDARLDTERLDALVPVAVRMMDNVVDLSRYPLPAQEAEAKAKRRIGLGVTGLADALVMLGLRYGSAEAVAATEDWLGRIASAAYRASAALAVEKGAFPLSDPAALARAPMVERLGLSDLVGDTGLRNALLTSIAPTGTISLFAGNVSSGIEPVFSPSYVRKVLQPDGSRTEEEVVDAALAVWRAQGRDGLPPAWVDAQSLSPGEHVSMQAAAQRWVDSSISKTVNVPEGIAFADFQQVYRDAWAQGCKGCTTYRPNAITGSVLSVDAPAPATESIAPRARVLAGATYKLRWPLSDHAIYVTINDVEEAGVRRPFEIFVNSKNMEHYAWTVGLTRMISAVFRRGGDVAFVAEELGAVFDPRGGAWVEGRYVPSILAAIGDVIREHLAGLGHTATGAGAPSGGQSATCPACGSGNARVESGCLTCPDCGHSACG